MTYNELIDKIISSVQNGTKDNWILTDDSCGQMRRILPNGIYLFVEFHDSPDDSDNVSVVRSFVDLTNYSDGELWFYGSMYYSTPEEFEAQGANIMAECVAENTWEVIKEGTAQQIFNWLNRWLNGYKNRHEYLMCLARDYGVPFDTVRKLANKLGEMEDFGRLVEILEKMEEEE